MTTRDAAVNQGRPLLDWLLEKYPDTPKKRAKQWILAGRVRVNGIIVRQPHQSMANPRDALELLDRHAAVLVHDVRWRIHPRVELLYLDSSFAILNKGAGLLAVPAPQTPLSALSILEDFLAGRLKAHDRGLAGRSLPPAYRRLEPLPVHRLDQYTSGVFCVALNPIARRRLIDQLKAHTMKREYIAYVEGRLAARQGAWRNQVQLSADELRQHVLPAADNAGASAAGVTAITHYEVLAEFRLANSRGVITKLRLRLETGRKHQIRAQAAFAGAPLVGDRTYHPHYRGTASENPLIEFPRQALHAETLSLEHPEQPGRHLSWTADLPLDLRQLEAALRAEVHPAKLA